MTDPSHLNRINEQNLLNALPSQRGHPQSNKSHKEINGIEELAQSPNPD